MYLTNNEEKKKRRGCSFSPLSLSLPLSLPHRLPPTPSLSPCPIVFFQLPPSHPARSSSSNFIPLSSPSPSPSLSRTPTHQHMNTSVHHYIYQINTGWFDSSERVPFSSFQKIAARRGVFRRSYFRPVWWEAEWSDWIRRVCAGLECVSSQGGTAG